MQKRILFLISDTGGGHRSASLAITAALDEITEPNRFDHRIDDVAAHCSFPLTQLGTAYSAALLRFAPPIYGALFHATNGRRRFRGVVRFCEPLYRERLRNLFREYRPDVIISVHPLLNHAALRARKDARISAPIITVITDLGRVHEGWLIPEADAVVVPAREVYERARERGVPEERLLILGHPVHPRFEDLTTSKLELRRSMGLPEDATIALLMAGGEGGGKLFATTLALAKSRLPLHLVVVCGRNAALQQKLEEMRSELPMPITVLGYSENVPGLMRAADLLVTKAGPGTLAEASVAEVPVVVYDFVPGQERGNLDYVRNNGIGVVALSTPDVVRSVRRIVQNHERLAAMRAHQTEIAPRGSARRIAALIASVANTGRVSPQAPLQVA